MRLPLPKRSPLLLPPAARNKWVWQWGENLGTGEQGEGTFVQPQPLWKQRENIRSTDPEGQGSQQSHVETCFRLPCFATVWVIKLAQPLRKTPSYSHHHQTPEIKIISKSLTPTPLKTTFLFWMSNIQPLWKSGLLGLSPYCVMASLCIFLCCYFEVALKSSISYKMVETTVLNSGNSWILLNWLLYSYCCAIFPPSSSQKRWMKLYEELNVMVSLIRNSSVDKIEIIILFAWDRLYVQGEKEQIRTIIWLRRCNFAINKVLIHCFTLCCKSGKEWVGDRDLCLTTLCLCRP